MQAECDNVALFQQLLGLGLHLQILSLPEEQGLSCCTCQAAGFWDGNAQKVFGRCSLQTRISAAAAPWGHLAAGARWRRRQHQSHLFQGVCLPWVFLCRANTCLCLRLWSYRRGSFCFNSSALSPAWERTWRLHRGILWAVWFLTLTSSFCDIQLMQFGWLILISQS